MYCLLLYRSQDESSKDRADSWSPTNVDQVLEVVNKQKSPILYYSLAAGKLYAWLLQPHKGTYCIYVFLKKIPLCSKVYTKLRVIKSKSCLPS